jgi:cytochrome c553
MKLAPILAASALPGLAQFEFFEARIRPVLATHCYQCHGADKATSGLRLDTRAGMVAGGSRGTAVSAGNPESSLILRAISHRDPMLKMPPSGRLPDSVIEDFREWIRHGAEDPREEAAPVVSAKVDWDRARRHWAFQPLRPSTATIDAMINARLAAEKLVPAPPADRATLLRRLTFDLTGLPPSSSQLRDFLADASPDAYERVVDRLLGSVHYGERQARHWLDLVRFAETGGHEFDFYRYEAWRYRDYAIRAFNQDVAYDRLVAEHLAGDLLPLERRRLAPDRTHWDTAVGSGFLGLGEERNGATDLEEVRTEMRDSRIDVFGKTFLGLTIACARCHDHKFDPITAADYYALGGIFDSARTTLGSVASPELLARTEAAIARFPPPPPPATSTVALRPGDELLSTYGFHQSGSAFARRVGGRLDSSRGVSDKLTGILVSRSFVPTRRYIHVRLAGSKFNPVREEPSLLAVTTFAPGRYPKGVAGQGDRKLRWRTITLKEEINQVCHLEIADRQRDGHIVVDAIVMSNSKEPPPAADEELPALAAAPDADFPDEPFGRVAYEDVPRTMRIHVRGSHHNLGPESPRRFLEVLGGGDPAAYRDGSGRLALASDLTGAASALVARVMVNRLWKQHFGDGLVRTVDNFGATGERPSHPELLDALAHRFIAGGWSIKRMHREMVTSAAYRRASAESDAARERDPRNRLLSHASVRRLDAESIRDAILAVSGSLDPAGYGPSVGPHINDFQDGRGRPKSGPLDGMGRRSVYLEVRRNFLTPLLLAFDYPLPTTTVGRRMVSSVPAQALTMMNNEFVADQAAKWARRGDSLDAMYLAAFARAPEPAERDRIQTFLHSGGTLEDVAHVLFNAKEFLFLR